jgi:hypothetical protein
MGLQTWDEDNDHPLQSDATSAKNYLGELQLEDLNRLVSMVLDFFEDQTRRGWLVTLDDAEQKLLEILTVNKRRMLKGLGRLSAEDAEKHAKAQYAIFDRDRRAAWKVMALAELNEQARSLGSGRKRKR